MGVSTEVRRASAISASQLCHETTEPVAVIAVPSGLLLDANDSFCRLFRVASVEDWSDPILSSAGKGTSRLLGEILRTWEGEEDRWVPRACFYRCDRSRVQGRIGVLPVPGGRKRVALFHVSRGRKPRQEGLRALIDQRLEQVRGLEHLRALGEFSSVMVHEIRTPLTSLRIGLDLLLQDPDFDSRFDRRMGLLVQQVNRIELFLGQVRDFAKPVSLYRRNISVREMIGSVSDLLRERFSELSIETVFRTRSVFADPQRLREILENVLLNAAESMEGRGVVRIRVSKVRHGIRFSVMDEGPGMSSVEKKLAFQLFHTTKRVGTGLGLSIVKKIVDLHGGRVSILSNPGRGTEVRIDFPLREGSDSCAS